MTSNKFLLHNEFTFKYLQISQLYSSTFLCFIAYLHKYMFTNYIHHTFFFFLNSSCFKYILKFLSHNNFLACPNKERTFSDNNSNVIQVLRPDEDSVKNIVERGRKCQSPVFSSLLIQF